MRTNIHLDPKLGSSVATTLVDLTSCYELIAGRCTSRQDPGEQQDRNKTAVENTGEHRERQGQTSEYAFLKMTL